MVATQLKVVGPGVRLVGVLVGTEAFQPQPVAEAMQRDSDELLRAFISVEHAQDSF